MRKTLITLTLATALVSGAAFAQDGSGKRFDITLEGSQETQAGDPDGSGTARLRVNPGLGQICYTLSVRGIGMAAAAHIHEAPAGVAGPVVVHLSAPNSGTSSGCADVGKELALEILRTPEDYYVNVHNAEFPAGALRGQLAF